MIRPLSGDIFAVSLMISRSYLRLGCEWTEACGSNILYCKLWRIFLNRFGDQGNMGQNVWEQGAKLNFGEHDKSFLGNKGETSIIELPIELQAYESCYTSATLYYAIQSTITVK